MTYAAMGASIKPELGDISRRDAILCLEVEKFCLQKLKIPLGASFLLAVSGGADSIAMAAIFGILRQRSRWRLSAVHVNHCLRHEAEEDAAFSADFCASLDVNCAVVQMDTAALAREYGCGLEEAGRIGRYRIFEEQKQSLGCDYIAVAHHLGDLCEDVLMRLTRGAGWPGLGGMAAKDEKRSIIRPLLSQEPERLRQFLRNLKIPWREDATNASNIFKRNRLRNTVLPLLRAENPNLASAIKNLHTLAEIDSNYWDNMLDAALGIHPWQISRKTSGFSLSLSRQLLDSLPSAGRLRLYQRALKRFGELCQRGGQSRAGTMFKLEKAWAAGESRKVFQFPGNTMAILSGEGITFKTGL